MLRSRSLLPVVGVLAVILAACGTRPRAETAVGSPFTSADSASAHRTSMAFLAAFDSLQWEPFRSHFAEDVTMFFPFAQFPARADGRPAVERVFNQFFAAQRKSRSEAGRPMVMGLSPRDLRVQMLGSGGAVVSFQLGADAPARRSIVLRRENATTWKVIHWHASPAPTAGG